MNTIQKQLLQFTFTENQNTAHLDYHDANGIRTISHTIVPDALGGRGIGTQLARAALDDARENGLRVHSLCPFIDHFVAKNPFYADLLV